MPPKPNAKSSVDEPDTARAGFAPYRPRVVCFHGVRDVQGYRLKIYSIVHGERVERGGGHDPQLLETALRFACSPPHPPTLPAPAVTDQRPGVGFVILHQGRTGDYFILAWWDRENELPIRVFVLDHSGWRAAADSEGICVWDLRIIWFEREAYVATVLNPPPGTPGMPNPGTPGRAAADPLAAYLARGFEGPA